MRYSGRCAARRRQASNTPCGAETPAKAGLEAFPSVPSAAASDSDEFGLIMKTALERMGCALAALWVPDKNIALSLTRSGQPMSPESLQRAQHHLMAWMQLQQRTIVVNHISKVASDVAAPYKILACPVRHPSERVTS